MVINNAFLKNYKRYERSPSKHIKYFFTTILTVSIFLSPNHLSFIHANNNVSCKISVIGDGELNVTSSSTSHKVNQSVPLSIDVQKNSELTFEITNSAKLNNVTINGIEENSFDSLKTNSNFTYTISDKCDIVFNFEQLKLENTELHSTSNIQQAAASKTPIVTNKTIMDFISLDLGDGWRVQMTPTYWKIDDNIAFCGSANLADPDVNFVYEPASEISKSNVRKILYYGYLGPKDKLTSKFGPEAACLITGELVSYYNGNGSILTDELSGDINRYIDKYATFMKDSTLTVPTNFKTYICSTNVEGINWKGEKVKYQPMIFWKIDEKGSLQIKKESTNPDITENNNHYSVTDAEYTVFKSKDNEVLTNSVGILKITSSGWSNTLVLDPGTYYIKETKAPQNYNINHTIYTVIIQSNVKTTVTYQDEPKSIPISLLLQKTNSDNNLFINQGLGNAQFTVKFFKGQYEDGTNPFNQGIVPDRTWIFKTDAKGQIMYEDSYKISGDNLYKTSSNIPALPLGTITIQESIAPFGYKLNDNIFVKNINSNTDGTLEVFNAPIIANSPIIFKILKKQNIVNIPIPGIAFLHTKPNGTTETLTTNSEGFIEIHHIEKGIHKIKEIYSIDGLRINPNEFEFQVLDDGSIQAKTNDLLEKGMEFCIQNEDGILTVYNSPNDFNLIIHKINQNNQSLDGAEFTLYEDADCRYKIDTVITKNGIVSFPDLSDRTYYYLKETKAPIGYRTESKDHLYKIYTESIPSQSIFNVYIDDIKYTSSSTSNTIKIEDDSFQKNVTFKIKNIPTIKLPETGSNITFLLFSSGILTMILALSNLNKQ